MKLCRERFRIRCAASSQSWRDIKRLTIPRLVTFPYSSLPKSPPTSIWASSGGPWRSQDRMWKRDTKRQYWYHEHDDVQSPNAQADGQRCAHRGPPPPTSCQPSPCLPLSSGFGPITLHIQGGRYVQIPGNYPVKQLKLDHVRGKGVKNEIKPTRGPRCTNLSPRRWPW